MPFLKIDTQTLTSTTYADKPAWDVFFAAMLIAAQSPPIKFGEPMPQLGVRDMEPTGWEVPPGEYGFAPSSGPGIIRTAQLEKEAGTAALERLGAPELDSRSQACNGRRLVRVDGGYIVINLAEFRRYDQTATERQRRRRARLKAEETEVSRRNVTVSHSGSQKREERREKQKGEGEGEANKSGFSPDVCEIAQYLFDAIREHSPDSLPEDPTKGFAVMTGWCPDIDKGVRIGTKTDSQAKGYNGPKITLEGAKRVIDHAHRGRDDFWQANLRSGNKLRVQYATLLAKAGPTGGRDPASNYDFRGAREQLDTALEGGKV